jgi:hypothetical protein
MSENLVDTDLSHIINQGGTNLKRGAHEDRKIVDLETNAEGPGELNHQVVVTADVEIVPIHKIRSQK